MAKSVTAVVGENDLRRVSKTFKGSAAIKPQEYAPSSGSMYGDIALVYLRSAASTPTVTLDNGSYGNGGGWFVTAGWGKTETQSSSSTLRWTAVPAISSSTFANWRRMFAQRTGTYPPSGESDHLVAGLGGNGADSCVGDSGGPLILPGPRFTNSKVAQDVQIGVVSYGPSDNCGSKQNVGFYTSVAHWGSWIQNTIAKNKWN